MSPGDQQVGGQSVHRIDVLAHHGDRRSDDVGEREVVEPDEGDVAREPEVVQRAKALDGEAVAPP